MSAAEQADPRGRAAARILADLRAAVAADEFTVELPGALERTEQAVFDWLAEAQPPLPPPQPPRRVPRRRAAGRCGPAGTWPGCGARRAAVPSWRSTAGDEVTVEWRVSG